jgi:hypothetical protein
MKRAITAGAGDCWGRTSSQCIVGSSLHGATKIQAPRWGDIEKREVEAPRV